MAERHDERVIRGLMSRALGVPVVQHDDGSIPGMFDFRFTAPNGHQGAAEATTLTDPASRAWVAMASSRPRIAGSRMHWMLQRRGRSVRFNEAITHLEAIAPLLEKRGYHDLRDVPRHDELRHHPSLLWLLTAGIRVMALGTSSPEFFGRVHPTYDSIGSFVPDSLDRMLAWLEAQLATERFDGEFVKLGASGAAEQHLVLRVDLQGVPPEHWFALTNDTAALPSRPPSVPGRSFTGLWLIPEMAVAVIWWTVSDGWCRMELAPDTEDPGEL